MRTLSGAPPARARRYAAEIVRRAERCIGLVIRKGQADGRIKKLGDQIHGSASGITVSPGEFAGDGHSRVEIYQMADGVTDEAFDAAINEAKAEKNLSRANVVRKVKARHGASRGTMAAPWNLSTRTATPLCFA